MIIPKKKLKSGFEMPVLGLGSWYISGGFNADYSRDKEDVESLKKAIDLGVTHIDTAELYGDGHAEQLIGQAIKKYDRARLFIVSKVLRDHLSYDDVINSCQRSLDRLGLGYLDLYLIHAPNPEVSLEETLRAFNELKKQGLIKEIGVSNFGVDQLKKAQKLTKNRIVTNQIHYSLAYLDWQDSRTNCHKLANLSEKYCHNLKNE